MHLQALEASIPLLSQDRCIHALDNAVMWHLEVGDNGSAAGPQQGQLWRRFHLHTKA